MKMSAVTGAVLLSVVAVMLVAGCSREKIDWKSAESADTLEAYDHFIERHPDSALATQARARMTQLTEDRDWQRATAADTADAYKQFLAQHANGKWAEEARIRVENFTLGTNPSPLTPPSADTEPNAATIDATAAATGTAKPGERAAPESPPRAAAPPPAPPGKPAPVSQTAAAAVASKAAPTAHPATAKSTSVPPPVAAKAGSVAAASQAAKNSAASVASVSARAAADTTAAGYGIQLGAFTTQAAALDAWKRLQVTFDPQLHGLFAHAVPVQAASGQLFRLQAPVGEESRARGICAALARQSQPCVVVLPQPH